MRFLSQPVVFGCLGMVYKLTLFRNLFGIFFVEMVLIGKIIREKAFSETNFTLNQIILGVLLIWGVITVAYAGDRDSFEL